MAPRGRAGRPAAGAVLCLAARAGAYDYSRIVEDYCHSSRDWGAIPQRPAGAGKLLQVQVFIRHGSRTQCYAEPCWPGDQEGAFTCGLDYLYNSVGAGNGPPLTQDFRTEYLPGRNGIPGNCKTGQLVPDGLHMEVANGERLREAYILREKLLPETLREMDGPAMDRSFFLRSTDVPRTKQSGMALFSGLYKDHRHARPPYLRLHTMDMSKENMIVNAQNCPAVQPATDDFLRTYHNMAAVEAMCEELGQKVDSTPASRQKCMDFLGHQMDCLMSRMCPTVPFHPRNATIPPKYLKDDAALLRRIWKTVDELQFSYFRAIRRPGIGPFVSEVLSSATAAAEGRHEARPFVLWSGHDTGPMEPLWAAFDLREGPPYWPPFASMLVLEVWNSSAGPLVRWVSNGVVAGRGAHPWAEFRAQAKGLVPSKAECQANLPRAAVSKEEEPLQPDWEAQRLISRPLAVVVPALAGAVLALLSVAACQSSAAGQNVIGKIRSRSSSWGSPSSWLLEADALGA